MTLPTLGQAFLELMPTYKSRSWRPFTLTWRWDVADADFVYDVSHKRCEKRIASYVIPGEIERSRGALRFGVKKEGHGFHKQRGDFCLVGGAYDKGHLNLFYRSVEIMGGLHYDLAIIDLIDQHKPVKTVTINAVRANAFALRGNSNEKLYARLVDHYRKEKAV